MADYEILVGSRLVVWGQATLTHRVNEPDELDPTEVLAKMRQSAASAHPVAPSTVRVRTLNRL